MPTTMKDKAELEDAVACGASPPTTTALALLYEQEAAHIYTYARRRVGTHMDADDVVAETFRRAVEHLDTDARHDVPLSAWLYRVARNVITDRYRRVAPLSLDLVTVDREEETTVGPEQIILRGEQRRDVWRVVAALPSAQRRVLWLRYGRDWSYEEIGRTLGQREGTVKQVAHRARGAIRQRLVVSAYAD